MHERDNLKEVRHHAKDALKGICTVNKVCDGGPTRFCMGQKFGEPIGLGGTGKGLAFTANVRALDNIKLKTRLISDHAPPQLSAQIYGRDIIAPFMPSSLSGVNASMGGKITESEFANAMIQGAKDFGTLGLIGNTSDEGQETTGIEAVKEIRWGVPVLKPQSNSRLLDLIKMAESAGAIAIGVDIDGAGSTNWERQGKPVFRKSVSDLRELVDSTELPFFVKGIMCVEDALAATDAGINGMDISNHGGRSLDSTRGVAEVLPNIVKEVKNKNPHITITAGGGVRTGFDVLKMLALGADAVLIGRPIARAALGGGATGVKLHLQYIFNDLRRGMLLTSCNTISEIDKNILDNAD